MNQNPGLQFFNQNVLAIRQLVLTIKSVCQEDFQKQLHMCIKKNPFHCPLGNSKSGSFWNLLKTNRFKVILLTGDKQA